MEKHKFMESIKYKVNFTLVDPVKLLNYESDAIKE